MNLSKIFLAGLVGFLLGVAASRVSTVRAGMDHVGVTVTPEPMAGEHATSVMLSGSSVIGVSCVSGVREFGTVCYVATTP